jgi:hypothetical protein
MADRERERDEDPLMERPGARDQDGPRDSPTTESGRARANSPRCPECKCAELTLIQDGKIVSLYKCPKCGHLTAPVKEPN